VLQYSPACAAGAATATITNVDSAAAEAVIVFEIGFIPLSFQDVVGMLFWQPVPNENSATLGPYHSILKMHSLHSYMLNLNFDGGSVQACRK